MSNLTSPLFMWLRQLIEPHSTFAEPQRRRARMLAAILLALIIVLAITLVVVFIANSPDSPRRLEYTIVIGGCESFLIAAYLLNRAGHYLAAARMTVTLAVIGPWVSVIADPVILRGDFVPLTYTALSILLCSILLSARTTMVLAFFQLAALWSLAWFVPATAQINWASLLTFVFFAAVFTIVANIISHQDLAQIDQQTHQLREQSIRDPLTGLYNRLYLEETLERELARMERAPHPLSILMLDADNFKMLNDTLGHAAGDEWLQCLGAFLKAHIRRADIACRYGGDEFVLILPQVPGEVALARAENLREGVKQLRVQVDGQTSSPITFSIGVASFPRHGATRDALLRAADAALYRAKHDGRDCVRLAD